MSQVYILNSVYEIVPKSDETFEIRMPLWGVELEASQYQVGLLQQFDGGKTVDEILEKFPFERTATLEFIDRCVEHGFIIPRREDGTPEFPSLAQPRPRMFHAPKFDPRQPPAFVFVGIPFDRNTSGAGGAKFGPQAIRFASEQARYTLNPNTFRPSGFYDQAAGRLSLEGVTLADAGDVFFAVGEELTVAYDRITEVFRTLTDSGAIPLILGGDHSVTYPVLRAFPSERLGIIHLDAHSDLGDSQFGGLHHGNVFSLVLEKLEFVDHVHQIGLRGLLEATEHLENPKVTAYGVDRFRELGTQGILERIPADIPYFISIDIDVVDPAFAPATGTPVTGGLYPHEIKELLRTLSREREIVGCDLVEVAPSRGQYDATAGLAVESILAVADGIVEGMQRRIEEEDG